MEAINFFVTGFEFGVTSMMIGRSESIFYVYWYLDCFPVQLFNLLCIMHTPIYVSFLKEAHGCSSPELNARI